jgi:hypothetical protein
MCNFFSALVLKSGEVFWEPGVDGHADLHALLIKKLPGAHDNTADLDKLLFARVEITPPGGNVFEKNIALWNFRIDENIIPTWWTAGHEKKARRALADCVEECIIDGQSIPLLENKTGRYIRNTKIEVVKNCNIREMWGSSQVGVMWESSQVGVMRESSQVRVMRESSQVGEMRESSQVGEMWESSQVGEMRESSQVGEMRGSSQVGVMRGSSQVGEMWGSSQVREMWESSQVRVMRGSSQVGVMRGSSQVGVMRGSSQVGVYGTDVKYTIEKGSNGLAILRYKKNIEIIHASKVTLKKFVAKNPTIKK